MHSVVLLILVACLLAVPGIPAALAAFPPGQVSIVTRSAAAFGLGYAVSGGCAFLLAAAHALHLSVFIPVWLAVSAVLWVFALRRASFRDHAHAVVEDIGNNRLPLLLGALVIAAVLILHFKFLYTLGGPRYVYYLNGIEIANAHGVPASTLEYGQSWPPATDKIFLDAFTGVLVLFSHNAAIGPGVLLWISMAGLSLGLWATAWELGLRRTGGLLPLLLINQEILRTAIGGDFTDYRAEDFGRAVAFCALALGIYAIRERKWVAAVVAGVVLAAASGTHLIPVVVVVIALCFVGVAELLRDDGNRERLMTLLHGLTVAAVAAFLGLIIRLFAGGSFGLGGAQHPAGYAAVHTRFDPTAFLFLGQFLPRVPPGGRRWYVPPAQVVDDIMAGSGFHWQPWQLWLLFAGLLVIAVLLFLLVRTDVRTAGVVGAGTLAGIIGVALLFSFHYRVYIDGTFGVRRLSDSSSLGPFLLALGVLEAGLEFLDRRRPRASAWVAVAIVVSVTAWLLPGSAPSRQLDQISHERTVLVNWARLHMPCDSRILVNQRTEGAVTSLTGRFALLEGMGPFLRVDKLPYVVHLMLSAQRFFRFPVSNERFLRRHDISYLMVVGPDMLGYQQPVGTANIARLLAAPFLEKVMAEPSAIVFKVLGAHAAPVSPLLQGPYLHCMQEPIQF